MLHDACKYMSNSVRILHNTRVHCIQNLSARTKTEPVKKRRRLPYQRTIAGKPRELLVLGAPSALASQPHTQKKKRCWSILTDLECETKNIEKTNTRLQISQVQALALRNQCKNIFGSVAPTRRLWNCREKLLLSRQLRLRGSLHTPRQHF